MIQAAFIGFLIFASFTWQTFGQPQDQAQSVASQGSSAQRVCECEELDQCYKDQLRKEHDILVSCREQCGSQIFLKPTLQKVIQCFDQYDHAKSDVEARRTKCIGQMGSRNCVSPGSPQQPQTFVINTTEFFQSGAKRDKRKLALPESINTLTSCIKICIKNQGTVQFNADGSLVKPPKTVKNGAEEKKQKNGNDLLVCANQLGCQLAPVDKKLEKQARNLCKLQAGPQDDSDLAFCTCLEAALGQNLHCSADSTVSDTCASPESACSGKKKTESTKKAK